MAERCQKLLYPARANPTHPQHQGGIREDYFGFSIMPLFPDTYTGVKILLVDGMRHGRRRCGHRNGS